MEQEMPKDPTSKIEDLEKARDLVASRYLMPGSFGVHSVGIGRSDSGKFDEVHVTVDPTVAPETKSSILEDCAGVKVQFIEDGPFESL